MSDNLLLSIIIPVYNTEKYIENTLQSIFKQSNYNFNYEIIIVNDGTLDHSMDVIKKLKTDNMIIVNQCNSGLSVARNVGLSMASGKYVWFVDSDDTVSNNSFSIISKLDQYGDVEVYAFDIDIITEETSLKTNDSIIYHRRDTNMYFNTYKGYDCASKLKIAPIQRFIYRKDFLDKYDLKFYPGILHEDNDFQIKSLCWAKSVMPIPFVIYNYLKRNVGSITSTFSMKRITDMDMIINNIVSYGIKYNCNHKVLVMIYEYVFQLSLAVYSNGNYFNTEYNSYVKKKSWQFRKRLILSFFKSFKYVCLNKFCKFILCLISPKIINKIK